MQVDTPPEENENVEQEHYVVENTSLVREQDVNGLDSSSIQSKLK